MFFFKILYPRVFAFGNVSIWEGGCHSEHPNHIAETMESCQIKNKTV